MRKQRTNCHTYSLCPEDCGEVDIANTRPFNNAQQNSSLEIWFEFFLWNNRIEGGGSISLHSLLTLKNTLKLPIK